MEIVGLAKKVTIYIGESDKWQRKPLYSAILELLRQEDCAGATVTRALAGFGAHSRIHTASLVDLSADLPLVIEWVDNPARVERVMPRLREMVVEGLITLQEVEVITYSHRRLRELPASTPVHDVMSRELHAVRPDTSLVDAVELLLDKVYRALPVVDEAGQVVGILTDGDLLSKAKLLAISAQRELTQAEMMAELQRLHRAGQTVDQVMTADPVTVSNGTTISRAAGLMVEHDIKRLPVVDEAGRLIGMVSRVDVLRALAQPPVVEPPRQDPPPGHHRRVAEIMMTNVLTVPAEASLAEIVGLMVGSTQRRVVVVDEAQRVVGIITDGDLLKRTTETERGGILQFLTERIPLGHQTGFHLERRTAREVMTSQPVCVRPETPLLTALTLFLKHRIKRLPVVDEAGRLVGLLGRGGSCRSSAVSWGPDPMHSTAAAPTIQTISDPAGWDRAVTGLPYAHVLQSWAWGDFKRGWGWEVERLLWSYAGAPAAAAQILRRPIPYTPWSFLYVPGGPALNYANSGLAEQVLADLEAHTQKTRALFIKIDPAVARQYGRPQEARPLEAEGKAVLDLLARRGWRFSPEQIQFRNTILIDLTPDSDDLLAAMKSKWRYNIRLAKRRGVTVRSGSTADIAAFYRMYAETAARDGFLLRPEAYYRDVWQRFLAAGQAELLLASVEAEMVAGLLLFVFGSMAWYMFGASTGRHRQLMPNHLLQWAAIERAKARGCTAYDMWGAPDRFDEADPMWGVYRFKRGFGGQVVQGLGAFDYPLNRPLYWAFTVALPRLRTIRRNQLTISN